QLLTLRPLSLSLLCSLFFFNVPAPPEISPLSLHDALPIFVYSWPLLWHFSTAIPGGPTDRDVATMVWNVGYVHHALASPASLLRSEEHTSELQSLTNLVCRLLLEKKKHQ